MNNMKNKKEIFKLIHNSLKLDPKVISFSDETNKFLIIGTIGYSKGVKHLKREVKNMTTCIKKRKIKYLI